MSEMIDRQDEGKIVLDGQFLREQAIEAVETFLMPLVGVYAAATGKKVAVRRRIRRAKKTS